MKDEELTSEQKALQEITHYKPAEIDYVASLESAAKHIAYYTVMNKRQTRISREVANYLRDAIKREATLTAAEMKTLADKLDDYDC